MPHPAHPGSAAAVCVAGIPEVCPPGEGMVLLDPVAFADVVPLGEPSPALGVRGGQRPAKMPVDVGQHSLVLGRAVCTQFVPRHCLQPDVSWPPHCDAIRVMLTPQATCHGDIRGRDRGRYTRRLTHDRHLLRISQTPAPPISAHIN
jgi:hypothetical protein